MLGRTTRPAIFLNDTVVARTVTFINHLQRRRQTSAEQLASYSREASNILKQGTRAQTSNSKEQIDLGDQPNSSTQQLVEATQIDSLSRQFEAGSKPNRSK